ncbi:MYM-type zinc finger protein [Pandoravirus inopinatum]|uniref:MYM-type zinc finger protein n=1 Tax=Pandoravirus inopinatum TaxID=1605721 RepID=A0A0B5IZ98_9VIRU|nr:MYM-type zinc finger protein [Pandoravirus inopinatum]AJF98198.1 MYM-type zinc finger protein [Pandoravirus inopinatum]
MDEPIGPSSLVGDKRKHAADPTTTTKVPRKRGRRSKKEIEEAAAAAAAAAAASPGGAGTAAGTIETEADALAARRAHQKTLSLNSLYGDAAKPDTREFMHVNMGHALMRRDDVFYLHPLSERCLIQRGSVPCPDPSRATVYRNTLDIRASGPCMHCDRECTAGRVPLPRAYDSRTRTYAVWGNFCSFPCAMAYQLDHGAGVYDTPHVLVLIHKMAAEVWGREGLVSPAPPRFCLRKFGGAVDPDDIEAVSERQYHAIVEAPFISWGMMVECKTVDVVGRAIKRLIASEPCVTTNTDNDDKTATDAAAAAAKMPSDSQATPEALLGLEGLDKGARQHRGSAGALNSMAGANSNGAVGGAFNVNDDGEEVEEEAEESRAIDLCVLADQEDDGTESETHDRIARAFNLRGLPPHDPHMEHPGALCRAGGVDGISASAGRRDAERRAERGISLLGTTRAAPSGMPSYSAPVAADTAAGIADEADPEAMGGSRWERFLQSRLAPTAPGAAAPAQTSPSP